MKYDLYITKVKNECIVIDNAMNIAYIKPEWRHALRAAELIDVELEDDLKISIEEIEDVLNKEVSIYNGFNDYKKPVLEWCFDMMFNKLGPILLKELHIKK